MLSWMRWLTSWFWSIANSEGTGGGFLSWFSDHWLSLAIFLMNGQAILLLGLAAAACNMAGNYVGSSLALKQSSKVTRPVIILVLCLLFLKVLGII